MITLRSLSLGVWLLRWLVYVLACAWIGLICGIAHYAVLGGLLAWVPVLSAGRAVLDWIWIGGAIFGVVAFLFGKVGFGPFKLNHRPPSRPTPHLPEFIRMLRARPGRPPWIASEAKSGAIYCGIAGLVLGFMLLSSWFSIAISPFGPESWRESIFHEAGSTDHMGRTVPGGFSSRHPLPLVLFAGPPVAFAMIGFILGGFRGILTEWIPPDSE